MLYGCLQQPKRRVVIMAKSSKGGQNWLNDVFEDNKKHNESKKIAKKAVKAAKTIEFDEDEDIWGTNTFSRATTKKTTKKSNKKASKKAVKTSKVKGIDYKGKYKRLLVSCKKLSKSICKLAKELKALR
jgi:hypothetical protein